MLTSNTTANHCFSRSFAQWKMDILVPFLTIFAYKKFLLVTIDYFIKWVKAEVLASITEAKACDFIWKSIIYKFGLPTAILTNNGCQFDNVKFLTSIETLG